MENKTNYDLIIKPKEINRLKERHSGIYILIGNRNNPLYVGQSDDLFSRVRGHSGSGSELSKLAKNFERVGFVFEKDEYRKNSIERYFVTIFHPPLNFKLNNRYLCKGFTTKGSRCKSVGHSNGYCFHHGGNNQRLSMIRDTPNEALKHLLSSLDKRKEDF